MANFTLASLGMLVLSLLAAASPAPQTSPRDALAVETFSWEQWVESIIANPETALSIKEALAAANQSQQVGSLNKRQISTSCNNDGLPVAYAPDAVWCINYLAELGGRGVDCGIGSATAMCTYGNAQVVGTTVGGVKSTNCNNIARAGGRIMDTCFRADNTVQGSTMPPEISVFVHLSAPTI